MEIEELFGLPAHPLVVHAAVVLLPLAAIATVVCAAVPRWRRAYAPLALVAAVLALGAVLFAQGSGEKLEHDVRKTALVREHTEQGERVLPWAIGVTVVAIAVTAAPSLARRRPSIDGKGATAALVALALVAGGGAVFTTARTGHSGAKATWNNVRDD